ASGQGTGVRGSRVLGRAADLVVAVGVAVLTEHVRPGGRGSQPVVVVVVRQLVDLVAHGPLVPSGGPGSGEAELAGALLAHLYLANLASHGHRVLVDHHHVARDLVV